MIYVSIMIAYSVLDTSRREAKPRWGSTLPLTLAMIAVAITVTYHISDDPVFLQVAFASIQVIPTAQVVLLLNTPATSVSAAERVREARHLYIVGATIFLTSFGIWNVDNLFCAQLRHARNVLHAHGLWFLAPLLQGHGWWHLGTGIGAHQLVVSSSLLVMSLKEEPENFELVRGGSVLHKLGIIPPTVRRVRPWKSGK